MLGLAVGITTAMFTIVDALILRPVPFRAPEQLAQLWMGNEHGGLTSVSPAVVAAWRESPAFDAVESATTTTGLVELGDAFVLRDVATVTPGIFEMLGGVRPLRGRLFAASDGHPNEPSTVLVSETIWRSLFGSDPAIVGRGITIDDERLTVIGILPAEFRFPASRTVFWRPTDLHRTEGEMARAYVRFAPNVPREDALRIAGDAARAADARNVELRPWVSSLVDSGDDYSNRAVPLLAGGVVLVFVVLSANAASLLLARLTARRREFSMRGALGASRGRLMRQALVETSVLGALGVAAGVGLAWALVAGAKGVFPAPLLLQTLNPLNLDVRAMAATSVAGLVATLAAGLLPALVGTRAKAADALRRVDRSRTESRGERALTRGLLVAEVAFACALLVGATLLIRSFANLSQADRGLDTAGVTTLWLSLLEAANVQDDDGRAVLVDAIEDELGQLPGVQQLAWSYGLPPGGGFISWGDWLPDAPGALGVNLEVERYVVSPEFFGLYGVPILKGRALDSSDPFTTVVVSERFARSLWGNTHPVGRSFRFDDAQFQVVGVAREINRPSINPDRDRPEFYHAYNTIPSTPMVSLRCAPRCPDPAVIRHQLATAHPGVRVTSAGLVDDSYELELVRPRAAAALASSFAVIALLAAAGGLYSVLWYAVSRRRREFGVRAALGASPTRIRRVVFRDGLVVTLWGLAAGSVFAVLLARALSALQYGVSAGDPLSLGLVIGTIGVTTLVAAWRPARAAARVDPARLLSEE
jgi:predicted permease